RPMGLDLFDGALKEFSSGPLGLDRLQSGACAGQWIVSDLASGGHLGGRLDDFVPALLPFRRRGIRFAERSGAESGAVPIDVCVLRRIASDAAWNSGELAARLPPLRPGRRNFSAAQHNSHIARLQLEPGGRIAPALVVANAI